jgi:hypothetical protein
VTQDQLLRQLKPLTVYPQWEVLEKYLDLLTDQHLSALTNTTSWEDTKYLQGRIASIKAIKSLPSTIQSMDR